MGILIAHIWGLIIPLITSHEPPTLSGQVEVAKRQKDELEQTMKAALGGLVSSRF